MVALRSFSPTTSRQAFERRLAGTYRQTLRARTEADAPSTQIPIDDDPELPMARLARALALAPDQIDFAWTAVACSIDGRLVAHLEALGGSHARRGLSPAVYAMLAGLDDASVARLAHWLASPNPLVDDGLLTIAEAASPAARAYVASPRLVGYLLDDEPAIAPLRVVRVPLALLHDRRQTAVVDAMRAAIQRGRDAVFVVEGPAGSGRATAVASAWRSDLVVLDLGELAPAQVDEGIVALRREATLLGAIPVLANLDRVAGEDGGATRRLVDRLRGPVVVTSTTPGCDLGTSRPLVRFRWEVPDVATRAELWTRVVDAAGATIDGDLAELAHRYRVGPAAIERAVASSVVAGEAIDPTGLATGLRHNIAERLGGLARRVEVTQTWSDLVIADDIADLVAGLVARVRHAHHVLDRWGYRDKIARGGGVAALLSGPPGTGKTMVAGLLARELGLDLYQVDLSRVVSKWVGETEKNLSRIFDAAEEGHALLLFDEADSLFGQRSADPKSANDRYANLEVNYLLQRVEAFGGITVLTTNLDTAIDTALKRRLAAHIVFAPPDDDERALLWERQTHTATAPLGDDVDARELARAFPTMTGANIRNAAVAAAFLAAAEDAPRITRDHVLRAGRAEYRSMGHMISDHATRSQL